MRTLLNGIFAILLLLISSFCEAEELREESINVTVIGTKIVPIEEIQYFARLFNKKADSIYSHFDLQIPLMYNVTICEDFESFRKITSYSPKVAAAYKPDIDRFYFQNVAMLRRNNRLDQAIEHEIYHCLISTLQKNNQLDPLNAENLFMSEIFAVTMCGNFQNKFSKSSMPVNFQSFKKNIFSTKNKSISVNTANYIYINGFGSFLRKKYGDVLFLKMLSEKFDEKKYSTLYEEYYIKTK